MIRNYFLITFRSFKKNLLFVAINLIGIGLAVACCVVAYTNWSFKSEWDSDHLEAENIFRIQSNITVDGHEDKYATAPLSLGEVLKDDYKDEVLVTRLIPGPAEFRADDYLFSTSIAYVDSTFFQIFTYEFIDGSFDNSFDLSKIYISNELAIKYFGKEDVAGQILSQIINGKEKLFTIGGVFKKKSLNSSFYFQTFVLLDHYDESTAFLTDWKQQGIVFLKLLNPEKQSIVSDHIQKYIEIQNRVREDFSISSFYLENLHGMADRNREKPRVRDEWLRGGLPKEAVIVPFVMAILLLLLACLNFTNTSIAISSRRLKEIGIRKVLGSRQRQLVIQFLAENLMLCFGGLIIGLITAEFLVPAYDTLWTWIELDYSYFHNFAFFIFLIIILFTTALISGSYAAFYITSFKPTVILKGKLKFGGTNWLTRILLGLQFFLSLLTILFAIAFNSNAYYQQQYDLGFSNSNVISVPVNNFNEYDNYRQVLSSSQDITLIAGTKNHIIDGSYRATVMSDVVKMMVDIVDVGEGYLEVMDIRVIDGREFRNRSENDYNSSIIVTEEFVKQIGWTDDPLGKKVILHDTLTVYVVGVAKDIHVRGLWSSVEPLVIRFSKPEDYRYAIVRTEPSSYRWVNNYMEEEWKKLFPNRMYSGQPVDFVLAETLETNYNIVVMFSFLGIFALLLTLTGLYSLVSLNILKKMKSLGMRKVLGASVLNIVVIINKEFILILLIASTFASILGYFAVSNIMNTIWDYYQPLTLSGLILSIAILVLTSIMTVIYKSISTARMNPTKILRDD